MKKTAQAIIDAEDSDDSAIKTLGEAVAAVEGDDEDMPMTAADVGEAVAAAVTTALEMIRDGADETAPMHAMEMDDSMAIGAMDWEAIAGAANVMDVRRLVGGPVKAMSVADTAVTDLVEMDGPAAEGTFIDGSSYATAAYKGIDGNAVLRRCRLRRVGRWRPDRELVLHPGQ